MKLDYQHLVPENFSDSSRVWIYQSNRMFSLSEALQIEELLKSFADGWLAHGAPVKGFANLFFGQFIVIMADESQTMVSGCSTDSSVRVIKDIEQLFGVDLFNRQLLAFVDKERIQILPLQQLTYALQNKFIQPDTLYFNNTVLNKKDFMSKWLIPLKESWLKSRIPETAA